MAYRKKPFNVTIGTTRGQVTADADILALRPTNGVVLKANPDNTGKVYIGGSDVTAESASATDGFVLGPGEAKVVSMAKIDTMADIYVLGSAAGQRVSVEID